MKLTRDKVIALARQAGVNGEPAGESDQGIDTWHGIQFLPCGSLTKLVELAASHGAESLKDCRLCHHYSHIEGLCDASECVDGGGFKRRPPVQLWKVEKP